MVVRFLLNRRWTFILALGVSLACCFVASQAGASGGSDGTVIGDPSDPGLGPPPSGDPDLPSGPGAKSPKPGGLAKGNRELGRHAAGDGGVPRSAWTWRLRVVMQRLRGFYIVRF